MGTFTAWLLRLIGREQAVAVTVEGADARQVQHPLSGTEHEVRESGVRGSSQAPESVRYF